MSIRIMWDGYIILSPLDVSPSLLFKVSQITLLLNVKIACNSKLLKDDKGGRDTETSVVTELYSPFFRNVMMFSAVPPCKC